MLQDYTLEELYYEYRDHVERAEAADEDAQRQTDKIDQDKTDRDLAWADEEEKKELEAEAKKEWTPSDKDKAWMEEQTRKAMEEEIAKAKELHGESFGEDIIEDFDGG